MKKISKGKLLIILGVALVVIDQIIKVLVKTSMTLGQSIDVLSWFKIAFVENEGMAFGMTFGGAVGKFCLSFFRIVLCGLLVWWINKLLRKGAPTGVLVGLTLITAGAFGNIIDCLFYGLIFSASTYSSVAYAFSGGYAPFMFGRVVDMFYFPLIDTVWPAWVPFIGGTPLKFFEPVFNFADSCVTCGAFYLIIFKWKFFSKD